MIKNFVELTIFMILLWSPLIVIIFLMHYEMVTELNNLCRTMNITCLGLKLQVKGYIMTAYTYLFYGLITSALSLFLSLARGCAKE